MYKKESSYTIFRKNQMKLIKQKAMNRKKISITETYLLYNYFENDLHKHRIMVRAKQNIIDGLLKENARIEKLYKNNKG